VHLTFFSVYATLGETARQFFIALTHGDTSRLMDLGQCAGRILGKILVLRVLDRFLEMAVSSHFL
jgi:hypothetical protein